ncbi:class II 3-deoxy-7-phosphoheptulonate synthase [Streptomyces violaceus]|uniref:Phospho-2-dehydro-3-deoxyheptonate aldolase n=1 Tax=Streptomyces violaceus TaxID=1936 RepID=A0ABZ1P2M7_STRVL|nr:3-deoxy-7-phosphoheptulonate synthase class II [Streptomyces violaceus]
MYPTHSHVVDDWCGLPAAQQPEWPDRKALRRITEELAVASPLVLVEECDRLRELLGAAARGEAFVLQGGDCAETFAGATADAVQGTLRTMLQMALVLTHGASVPVVKVGRMAGQFAKPRSSRTETRDAVTLPSYFGDAVNGLEFAPESRRPDPARLRTAYETSAATLNLVRAFAHGGSADLHQVQSWNRGFLTDTPAAARYERLAGEIDRTLAFMHACGVDPRQLRTTEFFTSHEGLLLDYEAALTRVERESGRVYSAGAHLLWIGERTRDPAGAHVEFFSRIANPVAVKLGPSTTPDELMAYADRLDPDRTAGRLSFVVRMGRDRVRDLLPVLVEKAAGNEVKACWLTDPMHGNTFSAGGHKTRRFDDVLDEVRGFFEVHRSLGSRPGGLHLELTGDDVTECLGGGRAMGVEDLPRDYTSACDPRLNHSQSLDLAFLVAEMLRDAGETTGRDATAATGRRDAQPASGGQDTNLRRP